MKPGLLVSDRHSFPLPSDCGEAFEATHDDLVLEFHSAFGQASE